MWERPTELLSTCKTCHCVARTSDTIFTAGYFCINHHFLWLSRNYRMQLKNVRAFFDLQPWGIFILYIYSHTVSNLRQGAGQLLSNFRQHGKSFRWPCRVFTEGDVGRGRGGVFCGCSCLKTAFFLFPCCEEGGWQSSDSWPTTGSFLYQSTQVLATCVALTNQEFPT